MKKLMLLSMVVLGVSAVSVSPVFAASNAGSFGIVEVESYQNPDEPTNPVDPVDPDNPGGPTDPTDPYTPTGNTDHLRIDSAPNFDFGTIYNNTKYTGNIFNQHADQSILQVSDYRLSENVNSQGKWTVKASLGEFKKENNVVLKGTDIRLVTGSVMGTFYEGEKLVKDPDQTATDIGFAGSDVLLSTTPVVFASNNENGIGTWLEDFSGENAELVFSGDTIRGDVGTYTSDLTWTISPGVQIR